ncbi:hypothetical protein [Listeria innocua]|uniref:hypothetical protein n=1 Tax=Listeria innocua TaxID=1642 RepID=UPI00162A6728|nr:hypothetical protein [Listeria innocua]MBC2132048.1 hypothetical protein [Listeria innocua]
MNEYVKIKLDTYNKFREIERNGRLSASTELFGGIISYETFSHYENHAAGKAFVKVNKEGLKGLVRETYDLPKNIEITWE